MRLVHSISMALFVSMVASLSACGSDNTTDASSNGGSGGTATGGTAGATSGTGGGGTGGTAGAGTSGTGGGAAADHPTDSSQAGLEAFLAMNTYTQAGMGFRPETTPSDGTSTPHLGVKRYFNETLIASKAAGKTGNGHSPGSMAVKDILTAGAVVGKAAMLRSDTSWIYYCVSSEAGRCYTGSMPGAVTYTTTAGTNCACHTSGTIISIGVVPAP